jgi:hypothetical protein
MTADQRMIIRFVVASGIGLAIAAGAMLAYWLEKGAFR